MWRRGKQVSFFWVEDGQGWGSEPPVGEAPSGGCLCRVRSRHPVRTWPRVPTARPAGLVDICLAVSPHFHVKGRRDVTGHWGPSAGGAHCSRPGSHRTGGGWRVEGKPTEGPWGPRAALPGRPAPSPSVPGPPGRPGLGPLRGPLPAPGQAVLMRGRPALPRGSRGARVCPAGRPASVTGRPALGTGPGNHLWVTRRLLSSWGTPSSTDLAWMPGRPSRGGWGLPRRGQEGTASLCRCTDTRVPSKGGLCPLSAGTQGFGRPRVRTPLELGRV